MSFARSRRKPLSSEIPPSAIEAANQEVRPVLQDEAAGKRQKHGHYKSYTADEKARIAKRAAECGVTSTVRHFAAEFADRPLSEGTVHVWVKQYKQELL